MPIVGKAATDACPDSESEIEQSDGAAVPARPEAESQPRQRGQRPGELPNGGDHWEIWIQNEKGKIRQPGDLDCTFPPRDGVSIFEVPSFLKVSTKREAYVPKIVSLGPYHHGCLKLKPMEIHKERALHRMMTRFDHYNPKKDFFPAVAKIFQKKGQEKGEIMNSYEKKYDSNVENLGMMIRDGCFILEILRTLRGDELPSAVYEPIFETNKIGNTGFDILKDMLKLENQIPLIVLQSLRELESGSNDVTEFIADVISSIVSMFNPFYFDDEKQLVSLLQQKLIEPPPECRHLLGVLHSLIVFPEPDKRKEQQVDSSCIACKGKNQRIPSAVELKNAGIKFKKLNSGGIGNIMFENGTIHLPPITITDCTEVLFRNLVALELCKPSTEINWVIFYVTLMDELINCGEDVAVLTRNSILTNYLGSDEEVAKLFNGLCTGVALSQKDREALGKLRNGVHNDYNNKMKVHFAQFVNEKFSSPWKALAVVGAVIGLVFTLVTAICSILAVTN